MACSVMSCRPTMKPTSAEVTLPRLMEIDDWQPLIGQRVQLRGAICDFELQHLLYTSLDNELQYVCLDVPRRGRDSYQLLAYTHYPDAVRAHLMHSPEAILTGRLVEVSGAGKGGGTHREYAVLIED